MPPTANNLPSVLAANRPNSAISMERALKQALELVSMLEDYVRDDMTVDRIHATQDDLEFMLGRIER